MIAVDFTFGCLVDSSSVDKVENARFISPVSSV